MLMPACSISICAPFRTPSPSDAAKAESYGITQLLAEARVHFLH